MSMSRNLESSNLIDRFLGLFINLKNNIDQRVRNFGAQYLAFGIFGLINYPIYYLAWSYLDEQTYESLTFRVICTFLCIPLVFHKHLPPKLKRWLPTYWYVVLTVTLPYFFTYMLLMNDVANVWLMSTTVTLFWLLFLVDWFSYVLMTLIGILLAWITFEFNPHSITNQINYVGLLTQEIGTLAVIIIFAWNKDRIDREKFKAVRSISESVSHEIKTPLLSISSAVRGLKNGFGLLSAKVDIDTLPVEEADVLKTVPTILDNISSDSEHIHQVINSLKISTLVDQRHRVEFKKIKLADCVEDALSSCSFLIDNSIELIVQLSNRQEILGDYVLLRHVFVNLIKNAAYALKQSGGGMLSITEECHDEKVIIFIKDTGIGIKHRYMKKVFNPFFTTKKEGVGTGIGLAFCKVVMDSHNGFISCSSKEGAYTTIKLTFPSLNSEQEL